MENPRLNTCILILSKLIAQVLEISISSMLFTCIIVVVGIPAGPSDCLSAVCETEGGSEEALLCLWTTEEGLMVTLSNAGVYIQKICRYPCSTEKQSAWSSNTELQLLDCGGMGCFFPTSLTRHWPSCDSRELRAGQASMLAYLGSHEWQFSLPCQEFTQQNFNKQPCRGGRRNHYKEYSWKSWAAKRRCSYCPDTKTHAEVVPTAFLSPISPIYWHCSENNPGLAGSGLCSLWIFSIWGSIQQLKHHEDFYKSHPSINYILLWHILVFTRFTWEMKQKLITSTDTSRKWMDLISPPDGLPLPGSTHSTSYSRETECVRKAHLSHQTDTSLLQCIYFLSRALTEVS